MRLQQLVSKTFLLLKLHLQVVISLMRQMIMLSPMEMMHRQVVLVLLPLV